MLDIRLMVQFAAVAEELSFTRAARRLNVAQPWLSARIRLLEQQVGNALLERSSRRVALTATGEHLLAAVRPLVASVESFEVDFDEIKKNNISSVRVGMRATGWRDLVQIRLLDQFEAAHPLSRLTVERGFTNSLIDRLQRGKLDFVFAAVSEPGSALESKPFSFDVPGLLMRPTDPLAETDAVPAEGLAGRRIAVLPYSLGREIDTLMRMFVDAGATLEPHRELDESLLAAPGLLMFRAKPETTDTRLAGDCAWRPVDRAPRVAVHLVRRRLSQHSPARESFWRTADAFRRDAAADVQLATGRA